MEEFNETALNEEINLAVQSDNNTELIEKMSVDAEPSEPEGASW